jgi:hypothetical protein
MIYQLIIREKAEVHLRDIYNWYEEQKKGLGMNFLYLSKLPYLPYTETHYIFS